jgi:hypothetical protein
MPILFREKVVWLLLNSDTSLWIQLADKYAVRDYVEKICEEKLLNELYGVYQSTDEIDYDRLPNSFVLKTTNGCASNIFVKDKSKIDISLTKILLEKWLKYPYGELTGQMFYAKIKPQIIAERLLYPPSPSDSLIDYKFYCINGEPYYILVISDRVVNSHKYKLMRYDLNWKDHPEYCAKGLELKLYDKPKSLDTMIEYAKRLSNPFPFVRVDFYEINNHGEATPIFGEMTFTPASDDFSEKFQKLLGDLIKLPIKYCKN